MSTSQDRLERRAAQRFDVHLPVAVKIADGLTEGQGFTQDLSTRGVFFYTDFSLTEGQAVELTLVMPSEITLTESMPVRCRGRVMRLSQINGASKTGVAVHLEGYEYLPVTAPVTEVSSYGRSSISGEEVENENAAMSVNTFTFRPVAL